MERSTYRVLVVDDYEPWRRFATRTLQKKQGLQVVSEASDGLEAVQKAAELQPDLILLDIGLPRLNGIEAARRIRKVSPDSKILFLSQESSSDLVQEALNMGALGYVVKTRAARELLAAVEAVCRGLQFVSGTFSGNTTDDSVDKQDSMPVPRKQELPSLARLTQNVKSTRGHEVRSYRDDAHFMDGFTRFITAALVANDVIIVVATESRRAILLQGLQASGVDVDAAVEQRRYVPLNVVDTFKADGSSDQTQFTKFLGDITGEAAKAAQRGHPRIAAY
jgi:DNA-binding NarL/FixJ family response regulator